MPRDTPLETGYASLTGRAQPFPFTLNIPGVDSPKIIGLFEIISKFKNPRDVKLLDVVAAQTAFDEFETNAKPRMVVCAIREYAKFRDSQVSEAPAEIPPEIAERTDRGSGRTPRRFIRRYDGVFVAVHGNERIVPAPIDETLRIRLLFAFSRVVPHYQEIMKNKIVVNVRCYRYFLYKLLEHCGHTEFLPFIKLLRDENKLSFLDSHWETICPLIGIEFRPTM